MSKNMTCIANPFYDKKNESWCGRNVRYEFHFQGLDHAAASILKKQGYEICDGCISKVLGVFDVRADACDEYACQLRPGHDGPHAGSGMGNGGDVVMVTGEWVGNPPRADGGKGGVEE